MGYYRAGFDVIGIDIAPQSHYPFPMIQTEAISWMNVNWWQLRDGFSAIHTSPPCQRYSQMSNCRRGLADTYPDLVGPTRDVLQEVAWNVPWVIENVPGAPLRSPVELCAYAMGRELYRHRWFESSVPLTAPPHRVHDLPGSRAGHWESGKIISVSGHCSPMWLARQVMDIDWTNREELVEAVPPYMTEHIGRQLMDAIPESQKPYRLERLAI